MDDFSGLVDDDVADGLCVVWDSWVMHGGQVDCVFGAAEGCVFGTDWS